MSPSLLYSRRTFLKRSLLATAAALLCPHRLWAAMEEPATGPLELALYNTHTQERLSVTYRTAGGDCDPAALAALDRLLRCHYTDEVHPIDPRALDTLALIDRQLGGHEIHIISGYRSPAYNALLQRRGGGVSSRSLHLQGRALDVRIPGIALPRLKEAASRLARGGVGYYPQSGFVHIDSGRVRSW